MPPSVAGQPDPADPAAARPADLVDRDAVDAPGQKMKITCGIDGSESRHDVALVDSDAGVLARRRIGDDAAGFAQLVELLAAHADEADPVGIDVAIERTGGCLSPRWWPPASGCFRSTRGRWPAAANATARPVASPTRVTRWCWATSCAPTGTCTDRCPPTASRPGRSRPRHASIRRRSGRGSRR